MGSREINVEPHIHLLLELEAEAARWRRRTMLLLSIMLHIVLIAILAESPSLFRAGARMMGVVVQPEEKPQETFLYLPPDLLKRLEEPPKTNTFSDKNRLAQGKSPVIDPNGLHMPYSRGNTKLPELAAPSPPPAPPQVAAAAKPPATSPAPGASRSPGEPKNQVSQLHLMDVPTQPEGSGGSTLRVPATTPGEAIQQSLEAAARNRSTESYPGMGDSDSQFNNLNPNFSVEGPTILSDTRGVNFGPYLARVIYNVKRNWYAEMPEAARLGQKGRVAIIFEIVKDGSVPQLRLVGSSGMDALDRAALAGIRLSTPFPPLPAEFTGNHLVLQFIFLYNMGYMP